MSSPTDHAVELLRQAYLLIGGSEPPPSPLSEDDMLRIRTARFYAAMQRAMTPHGDAIRERPGWLYFVRNPQGEVKIGATGNLNRRLTQLAQDPASPRPRPLRLLAARRFDGRRAAFRAERLFHDGQEDTADPPARQSRLSMAHSAVIGVEGKAEGRASWPALPTRQTADGQED